LIVKITFTKLRLLGVKCIYILFIFNNTLPDWGEAVGQPRDLWSKPCTHCFTMVAFFGDCERPWKWVLQGSWWYFCPPAQVLQNSSPKNFWQRVKKSISSTIFCPSNFPTWLSFCPQPTWTPTRLTSSFTLVTYLLSW